jgi:hypothetical protein
MAWLDSDQHGSFNQDSQLEVLLEEKDQQTLLTLNQ